MMRELYFVVAGQSGDGLVRVIQRRTAERVLLKGFSGKVLDISFAHLWSVVLGTVDQFGNLTVYEILEDSSGKIEYPLSDFILLRRKDLELFLEGCSVFAYGHAHSQPV